MSEAKAMLRTMTIVALALLSAASCRGSRHEADADGDSDGDGDGDSDADSDLEPDADQGLDADVPGFCDPSLECCTDLECTNDLFCDGVQFCDRGECQPDPRSIIDPESGLRILYCDDGVECTDDFCDELSNRCVSAPVAERCDDADPSNGMEICAPSHDGADARGCITL